MSTLTLVDVAEDVDLRPHPLLYLQQEVHTASPGPTHTLVPMTYRTGHMTHYITVIIIDLIRLHHF